MPSTQSNGKDIESSVIVLHDLSTDSLILTKRSEHLKNHPGEICFPGGFKEPEDKDLFETALRELNEELGIPPERVTLIREMESETTLLGAIIYPWLASIECLEPYQINTSEVDSLVTVSLKLVRDNKNYKERIIDRKGIHFKTWEFIPNPSIIWGATARIMKQLAME